MEELTPLQRRLRRLGWLAPAFAIAAAVLGFLPDGFDLGTYGTSRAGGYSIAGWAFFEAIAGSTVRIDPKRRTGWAWFAISILLTVGGAIAYFVEQFTMLQQTPLWPAQAMAMCVGCTLVLTTIALPIVLIASRSKPPEVPPARVQSSG